MCVRTFLLSTYGNHLALLDDIMRSKDQLNSLDQAFKSSNKIIQEKDVIVNKQPQKVDTGDRNEPKKLKLFSKLSQIEDELRNFVLLECKPQITAARGTERPIPLEPVKPWRAKA